MRYGLDRGCPSEYYQLGLPEISAGRKRDADPLLPLLICPGHLGAHEGRRCWLGTRRQSGRPFGRLDGRWGFAARGYPALLAARAVRQALRKAVARPVNLPLEDTELAQGVLEAAQEGPTG